MLPEDMKEKITLTLEEPELGLYYDNEANREYVMVSYINRYLEAFEDRPTETCTDGKTCWTKKELFEIVDKNPDYFYRVERLIEHIDEMNRILAPHEYHVIFNGKKSKYPSIEYRLADTEKEFLSACGMEEASRKEIDAFTDFLERKNIVKHITVTGEDEEGKWSYDAFFLNPVIGTPVNDELGVMAYRIFKSDMWKNKEWQIRELGLRAKETLNDLDKLSKD